MGVRVLIWGANPLSRDSAYWFWLKTGMEAVGHQVIAFDALPLAGLFGVDGMQQILLQAAKAYRVQVALVLPQNFVEPAFIEALKAMGIMVVSFRYDDCMAVSPGPAIPPHHWRFLTQLDPSCHLSVTVSRHIGPILAAQGLQQPTYLPMPWGWHAIPAKEETLRPVIAFCGSPKQQKDGPYSFRLQVARAVHEAGLPLELHHDGWREFPDLADAVRPTPGLGAFYRVIRSSMVNLSLCAEWLDHPYRGIKGLNLEIASVGGPQISTPSDELDDIFAVGQDIVTAETPAEFVAAARDLLRQPERARQLGRNARRQVMQKCGWDVWWQAVAGHLETTGVRLDLQEGHVQPDAADTAWLATALTAVGHGYEKQGKPALADVYYEMVLSWRPDSYAANAGRARVAGDLAEALPFWRHATHVMGPTLPVMMPCPLGMPGVGDLNTTHYRFDAANRWLAAMLGTGQLEGIVEALDIGVPYDVRLAVEVADRLFIGGDRALALEAIDMGLCHWPESPELLELRRHLLQIVGRQAMPARP